MDNKIKFKIDRYFNPNEEDQYKILNDLLISPELLEYFGGGFFVCQRCEGILKMPAYFCKDSLKLYCYECQFNETKDINLSKTVCRYEGFKDNHMHIRISNIKVMTEQVAQ